MKSTMRSRIDYLLNDALAEFAAWLRENKWQSKEWDTVAIFTDGFLRGKVGPDSAIKHQTQIRTESQVATMTKRGYRGVRKDVVIWPEPFMSVWDANWQPSRTPRIVMEWKQYREPRRQIFNQFDCDWIRDWTAHHPKSIGYVVTVDVSGEPVVHWKIARNGQFRKARSA